MPALARALALPLALALPGAALAQQPSLWDLITPERIVTRIVQMGIMGLRTQADITYGGITVSPLTGLVALTDVSLRPRPPWDTTGTCEIRLDRLTIRSAAVDEADIVRLKAQATGAALPGTCLPPEVQQGAQMVGVGDLGLSRLTMDIDYRISSGAAAVHLYARADNLASVSLDGDFAYFWFDGRRDMDEPLPVAHLREARLTVENLGGWDLVKPLIPPPFTDPASAGQAVDMLFAEIPPMPPGTPEAAALSSLQASAIEGWAAFLASPRALVVETGFDPGAPVFLNPLVLEDQPEALLGYLQPVVSLTSARARAAVPAAILQQAREAADQLGAPERLQAGLALASGVGAVRDVAAAAVLLAPLAEQGDPEAAVALARALEGRDPAAAYGHALTAAAAGAPLSGALLDRIEARLPFATVLAEQAKKVEGVEHPASALEDLGLIREQAAMRLTGRGQTRSYATAALWALIGTAAGDAESADILEEIDERVRLAGPEAAEVWAAQEAAAVELATSAWISFDLPALFSGR